MPLVGSVQAGGIFSSHGGLRLGAITVALILFGLVGSTVVTGAAPTLQEQATILVTPAEIARAAGERFEVNVAVEGVNDLGAFELVFAYDPALVQIDEAKLGPFIGSTNRTVIPVGIKDDRVTGRVSAGAVTLGTTSGASGDGVLVTLSITALRAGEGSLVLSDVRLADTQGTGISASVQGAQVVFTGDVVLPTATLAPATITMEAPATEVAGPTPAATAAPNVTVPATFDSSTSVTSAVSTSTVAVTGATDTPLASPTPETPTDTPEPIETQIVKVATATAHALRTAIALGTVTPRALPSLTPRPGETAIFAPKDTTVPGATPPPPSSGGTGSIVGPVLIGFGALLGAGGIFLWRHSGRKSTRGAGK